MSTDGLYVLEFENFSPPITVYIFSLLLFMAKNREQFKSNSEIHGKNTRYTNNFQYPSSNPGVGDPG
jgi:hypothetical protein